MIVFVAYKKYLLIAFLIILNPFSMYSDEESSLLRSQEDGSVDISDWLLSKQGFLPLPVILTEPAVNWGGGATVLYFHPQEDRVEEGISPDMTGGFFAYTGNHSMVGGAFHLGFWREDSLRYIGALLRIDGNLNFYSSVINLPVSFNMAFDSWLLFQELTFRLGKSDFFIGPRYLLFLSDSDFTFDSGLNQSVRTDYSNPGVVLSWDSRNTIYTPSDGRRGDLSLMWGRPVASDQKSYGRLEFFNIEYIPAGNWAVFGSRTGFFTVFGYTPQYVKPGIMMRGVPMGRYQGDVVLQTELEGRFHLTSRWDLLAFGGGGLTFLETQFQSGKYNMNPVWMAGAGFRYQIARKMGMSLGVDFALSNDDWTLSIVLGNPWR